MRLLLKIRYIPHDTYDECYIPHIHMEIARCLLTDIISYYESDEWQKDFIEWKKSKDNLNTTVNNQKECA